MNGELYINEIFGPTIQGEGAKNVGAISYFVRLSGCDMNPPCKWCDTLKAHNLESGTKMTYMEIANKLRALHKNYNKRIMRIIITGGNPCMQDLSYFSNFLFNEFSIDDENLRIPLEICLETQGTIDFTKYNYFYADHVVFSPKPPSAFDSNVGQDINAILDYYKRNLENINSCNNLNKFYRSTECKIVVFAKEDLRYMNVVFNNIYNVIKGDRILNEIFKGNLNDVDHYAFTIQIGTPCNAIKDTISAQEVIDYVYSDDCYFDDNMIQKIRILPQVHRLLGVE